MTRRRSSMLVAATVASVAAAAAPSTVAAQAHGLRGYAHKAVCSVAPAGQAHCLSHYLVTSDGSPLTAGGPVAGSYGPSDLQSAYALSGAASGAGQTVAVVDAYDNPDVASDLAAYRSEYGLPACTTASGCFRKVNEKGQTSSLPRGNTSWGQEIDLDVEMVSATCPSCKILLVEASSTSMTDLGTAVNTAAKLGANAISNSYGGSEFSGEVADQSYYNHPGIAITASAGDSGYGVSFPAASSSVTAVGGTTLTRNSSTARGWTETAWSGTGGGCSAYIPKPTWQTDAGCSNRTDNDVSVIGDPNTGVAVYDSYGSRRGQDWMVFGGTSVGSPIVASLYARAHGTNVSSPYLNLTSLNDVTSGSDGTCPSSVSYLCTAGVGYDGPTGLGTPIGLGAF